MNRRLLLASASATPAALDWVRFGPLAVHASLRVRARDLVAPVRKGG